MLQNYFGFVTFIVREGFYLSDLSDRNGMYLLATARMGGKKSVQEMAKGSGELKIKCCLCRHRAERELADALD